MVSKFSFFKQKEYFETKIYLDVEEFEKFADNGDIILFKSQTFGNKVQRVVTRSGYDHVGMIVLWETEKDVNTIFLLEAVYNDGVRLVEFLPNLEKYFEVNKYCNILIGLS